MRKVAPNATHYADISDTTIWRVWFTRPEGMSDREVSDWLATYWSDPDAHGIHCKDFYDAGDPEIIEIHKLPEDDYYSRG